MTSWESSTRLFKGCAVEGCWGRCRACRLAFAPGFPWPGTGSSGQNSYDGQILANFFLSGITSSASNGALPSGEA